MNFKILFTLLIGIGLLGHLSAQEEPKIVPEKLTDNLYVLYGGNGQGANVGLYIGEDGLLLVDGMKGETNEKLMKIIRSISDKPIRQLINTHADFDHAGANTLFMEQGATVYMQENAPFEGGVGSVYFQDKITISLNEETVEAYSVVSHSFCDALIYFKERNVVFMGDTFTNNWYATFNSGGVVGQFEAIDVALDIGDEETVYVPGHGLPTDAAGLIKYREASGEWVAKVGELYREGVSVDEMVKNEDLNQIKKKFIDDRTGATIPQARLKRFIERTISICLIPPYPINPEDLKKYTGLYQYEDGTREEVYFSAGKLFIRKKTPYQYISELIPQSEQLFHMGGSITMWIEFNSDGTGFTFKNGSETKVASKVD